MMDWLCHSDKVGARGLAVIAICLWWVNREASATLLFFIAYKGKGRFICRWRGWLPLCFIREYLRGRVKCRGWQETV